MELYQAEESAHIYRREGNSAWHFNAIDGLDATLMLRSVSLELPLAEIYETVELPAEEEEAD